MSRRALAAAAFACGLFSATPALGATYTVAGFTDGGGGCESVGAGDGPCVIFMAGARKNRSSCVYTRSEAALRHGAGVETETTESREAHARFPQWQPGRPAQVPF